MTIKEKVFWQCDLCTNQTLEDRLEGMVNKDTLPRDWYVVHVLGLENEWVLHVCDKHMKTDLEFIVERGKKKDKK